MAKNIEELKAETGIEKFDAILEVKHDLTFALAGGEGDDEYRLTDDGIWLGPFAHVRRIPAEVYGITHWNNLDGDPVIHGLPAATLNEFDCEDILALIHQHKVAIWLQAPPDA